MIFFYYINAEKRFQDTKKNPKTTGLPQSTEYPRESPQFHGSACRNISEFSRGSSAESADFQFPRAAPLKVPEIQFHGRFPKNGGSKERAIPVVELPVNGSKIQAFSFVEARIIRARSGSGFWVGCFPQDFSHLAIAGRVHKSRIWVPPLISFISS